MGACFRMKSETNTDTYNFNLGLTNVEHITQEHPCNYDSKHYSRDISPYTLTQYRRIICKKVTSIHNCSSIQPREC